MTNRDNRSKDAAEPSAASTPSTRSGQARRALGRKAEALARKESEEKLRETGGRLRFETLLADVSARFTSVAADRLDDEIHNALTRVMEFLQVDQCALLEIREEPASAKVSHAVYGDGVKPVAGDINLVEFFPWCYRQLTQGKVLKLHRLDDYPEDARTDRHSHAAMGIKSALNIPVAIDGGVVRTIVINDMRRYRSWPGEYIPRLRLLGEIFANALDRRETMSRLDEHLGFERLLTETSEQFINLPPEQVDSRIVAAQQRIGEFLGVDFSSLWEWLSDDSDSLVLTHYYRRLEGPPLPDPMRAIEYFPWVLDQLLRGERVILGSLEDAPEGAKRDVEVWRQFGIKNAVVFPMLTGNGKPIGAVSFDDMVAPRVWSEALINRLELVAQIFANAIARRRSDQALRESEERLTFATAAAGAGPWVLDVEKKRFWLGPKIWELLDLPPGDHLDLDAFVALVHPADRPSVDDAIRRALQSRAMEVVEYRIVRPDGQVCWLQSRGRFCAQCRGSSPQLTGITADITDRKRGEEALRLSEARLSAGAELAGLGSYEVDFSRPAVFVDDRFQEICDVPGGWQATLRSIELWMDRIHPDDRPRVLDQRDKLHAGTIERVSLEYRYLHPVQGQKWILHIGCVAERDAAGNRTRTFGVIRDITERKRIEAESNKRLRVETLVADLSASFVKVVASDRGVDAEAAVRRICECLGAETGSIWMAPEDGRKTVLLTHIWRCEGLPPVPLLLDARDYFPWTLAQLGATESTCIVLDPEKMPPEAAEDRKSCAQLGVKNSLNVSLLASDGQLHGVFALNFARDANLSPLLVGRVEMLGRILLTLLVRERQERAQAAGRERMRVLTEMLDAAPGGVMVHDERGRVLYANRWTMQLHGYEENELARLTLFDLVEPEALEQGKRHLRNVLEKGEDSFDTQHRRKDGSTMLLHVTAHKTLWNDQPAILSVHVDITERERAGEALKKALGEVQLLRDRLQNENLYLRQQMRSEVGHGTIVGESEPVKRMLAMARRVASTDSAVLISGETGTGKELLAQAIHDLSSRKKKLMVKVNCAALPAPLIESELFGREKGAYTGAMTQQMGRFELANGSTIFLDEIGDLPLDLQVKLLRVLQDGVYERLGSHRTLHADIRVIAATNRDLAAMIKEGKFREDLFHRLNVFPIEVPPLRTRVTDIPLLAWTLIQEFNAKMGRSIESIPKSAMEALKQYPWPGNVRELRNVIERAMIVSDGRSLNIELPDRTTGLAAPPSKLEDLERQHILDVLGRTHWRISGKGGAAKILGLVPTTLHSRMKKLGIARPGH